MKFTGTNGRTVSSFGRVPGSRAGCRGFKPRPDQHSGSLNNRGESAAFVMTSAINKTFQSSRVRTINRR